MLKSSPIEFHAFEKRNRAALINSLSGFKSANLLGTMDSKNRTNLTVVSSAFHLGADPALLGVIFRPHSVPRHGLENLLETKVFTLNHINSSILKAAHQCAARYPKDVSEFEATGLTPLFKEGFKAPYVGESLIQLGLEVAQHIPLEINGTEMIIAEIKHLYAPQECLQQDGYLDIEKAQSLSLSGLDSYHKTQRIERLSYAKPGSWPRPLDS